MITHSKTRQAIATALLPAIVLQLLLASHASAALLTDSVGSFKIAADLSRRTSQENAVIQAAAVLTTVTAADGNPYPKAPPFVTGAGPAGGGLLPSGTGAPLTDSYGAKLGYCSWDNGPVAAGGNRLSGSTNNVGAPVFAVVSAGLDGVFNRSCAEIGAGTNTNNDDFAVFKTTMQVKFGAAGTVYFSDPVPDKTALDLLTGLKDGEMRLVKNNNALYRWDVNVAAANKWTSVSNTYTASNVDITGGQINGTQIGNITPSTGAFSTLTTPNATITGGTLNGTSIGASVASTGAFTTLTATGAFSALGNATFGGNLNAAGIITGGSFVGNGASLTNLNGSAIASGIVAPAFGGTGVNASAAPAGALLIGNGNGFSLSALAAGAGIGITTGPGSILLTNNGVTSFNARTGAVNLTLADVNGVTNFGIANVTLGISALPISSSGAGNTGVGTYALATNTTGSYNTGVGGGALQSNSSGTRNTAFGLASAQQNTTGLENVAVGVDASQSNTTGSYNTALGRAALRNGNGNNNVATGYQSGYTVTNAITGGSSTFIGSNASIADTAFMAGSGRITLLGADASASGLASANANAYMTAIGSGASVTTANTVVLGRTTDKTVIGATGTDGSAYNLQVTGGIKALSGGLNLAGGDLVLNSPTIIGLLSARPAAGIAGRIYLATDTNQLYRDDGTSWYALAAGSVALSSLTAATNANTINNGANAQTWNWALTGNSTAFNIGENTASTGGTGTQYLASIGTLAGSTAVPLRVASRGVEAFRVDSVNPQLVANNGTTAAPSYSFNGDQSTGFYLPAAGQLGASVGGVRSLSITAGSLALGKGALIADTSGNATAIGTNALAANTTGPANVATGFEALNKNTTGNDNTATGYHALYLSTGAANTATGSIALASTTTGSYNVATGAVALYSNTTGFQNNAYGVFALSGNTTGSYNVAIGDRAGHSDIGGGTAFANITGSNNTFVGAFAIPGTSTQLSYATALGSDARVSTSNTIVLGRTIDKTVIGATGDNGSGNKLQVAGGIGASGRVDAESYRAGAFSSIVTQGAYLQWNKDGNSGITYLINQKGLGSGGISFGESSQTDGYTQNMFLSAGGNLKITGDLAVAGTASVTNGKPIFFNGAADTNWGIYRALAGAGLSASGGTAAATLDGRTAAQLRFRAAGPNTEGFMWENSTEQALMSLTSDTGNLYTRGKIYVGNDLNVAGNLSVAGSVVSNLDFTPGNYVRFGHPNQTDANDGKMGAGLFTEGLNIVGTQTVASAGRKVSIFGQVNALNGMDVAGVLTAPGGSKIVVQNSQDGGPGRGLYLWNSADPGWGIYMSTPGAGKSLGGTTAPASLDGRGAHAFRSRIYTGSGNDHAFIWENTSDQALMSLTSDTGNLYTKGSINALGNLTVAGTASVSGVLNATGGAKIVVQNMQDGGPGRGIYMWDANDPNWGYYMGQAGAGKSLIGGTAPPSLDGRFSYSMRSRIYANPSMSFIWENSNDQALMSLSSDTGNLYTKGNMNVGGTLSVTGAVVSNLDFTSGNYARFGHPNQFNSDDGKIGAGLFSEGLNIVGTQTVASAGRKVTIYGTVNALNNVNVSGNMSAGNGSVAAPSYTFAGDTTTGLYLPSAGQLAASVGGVKSLSITAGSLSVGKGALAVNASGDATAIGTNALAANTSGYLNTAVGVNSLLVNTTGNRNTAVGADALRSNTTGIWNTGIGNNALSGNIAGDHNVAIGISALVANQYGSNNLAFGSEALHDNVNGSNNVAVGRNSLYKNTSNNNVAIGGAALFSNVTGSGSVAVGYSALSSNTGGTNNVAIGNNAMASSTGGDYNIGIGYLSLLSNTSGSYNVAIGPYSLLSNTTGSGNMAYGVAALYSNTTGSLNVAVGRDALKNNSTGSDNTASGDRALTSNTTGIQNTATGSGALGANTTGSYNEATGFGSLSGNTTGSINDAYGVLALAGNTSGFGNVAMGHRAGYSTSANVTTNANTIGNNNTFLGSYAMPGTTTQLSYATALGSNALVTTSNTIALGRAIDKTVIGATGDDGSAYNLQVTGGIKALSGGLLVSGGDLVLNSPTIIGLLSARPAAGIAGRIYLATDTNQLYRDDGTVWNSLAAGSVALSSITAATAANTINNGVNAQTWNWQLAGNTTAFNIGENVASTGGTGMQYLAKVGTLAGSTAIPFSVSTRGTEAFRVDSINPQIVANAGTAAAPSYTFDGSQSTGFYSPAANELGASVGGIRAMRITAAGSMALGTGSLLVDTSGNSTALGTNALAVNTTGVANTAVGFNTLYSNTTGSFNTAVGFNALYSNTTGLFNNAVGFNALYSNTTGLFNNALGNNALGSNTTGNQNNAYGRSALYANTTGSGNNAFGYLALKANTTGSQNNAYGSQALYINTTGSSNNATGAAALFLNTTGSYNNAYGQTTLASNSTGVDNSAFGDRALVINSTGGLNSAFGRNSLYSNSTGNNNSGFGRSALYSNTLGNDNVALGRSAGDSDIAGSSTNANTTGSNNTFLGSYARPATPTQLNYATALGSDAQVSSANTIVLGRTTDKTVIGATGTLSSSPNNAQLQVTGNVNIVQNATLPGLVITGKGLDSTSPTDNANGVFIGLGYNSTGNRQVWISATESIGSSTNGVFRYSSGAGLANVDAVTGDGTTRLPVNIGSDSTNVAIGAGVGNGTYVYNSTLPGKLSVYAEPAGKGLVVRGNSGQTGNLLELQNNAATSLFSVNSSGNVAAISGTVAAPSYSFAGDTTTGLYLPAAGQLAASVGGARSMLITSTLNTGVGYVSLQANSSGAQNTAIGGYGQYRTTTGSNNSSFGVSAMISNTTGSGNTAIGTQAYDTAPGGTPSFLTTASNSTFIGYRSSVPDNAIMAATGRITLLGADTSASGLGAANANAYMTAIGSGASVTSINTVVLGRTTDKTVIGATGDDGSAYNLQVTGGVSATGTVKALRLNISDSTGGVGSSNLVVGLGAMSGVASGNGANTAVGINALAANTNGRYNTAGGFEALKANTSGDFNVAYGSGALIANISGYGNSAFGTSSLYRNTTGVDNIAVGVNTMFSNTTGSSNTAVGTGALYSNTTVNNLTAIGSQALAANTTGANNVATGFQALLSNTAGNSNTASGYQAMQFNTTGNNNAAYGTTTLYSNTTGSSNTAAGFEALNRNTTASDNTATGYQALKLNTGVANTATGSGALAANTIGSYNEAMGFAALSSNTSGFQNDAYGTLALAGNTTGSFNVAIGDRAGHSNLGADATYANTTGSNNTFVGSFARPGTSTQLSYATALGSDALVSTSSTIVLGRTTDKTVIGATGTDGSAYNLQVTGGIKAISGGFNANNGTAAAPGYMFAGEATTGLYLPAAGQLAASVSGVRSMLLAVGSTGVGIGALLNDSAISNNNSAFGLNAMGTNSTGTSNTAIGEGALYLNTSGANNVALGRRAGHATIANIATNTNISGSNNTFLGAYAMPGTTTQLSYATALGSEALVTTSNTIILGRTTDNVAIGQTGAGAYQFTVNGTAGGTTAYAVSSDRRFKMNITPVINAVNTIKSLEGVHYEFNQAAFPEKNFESGRQLGFIAQQIENFVPEVVRTDRFGYKSVQYSQLVPLLAEGIKEQQQVLQYLSKKDPTTLLVDIKTFQANDAVFENIKSTNIKTANLEAESARIKKLDADRIEARYVRSDVMKTGEVEIFVSFGSFQPIFNPLQDSQYIVNATAEDGSSAFASVAYMSGRLTVTPISGKGVDVTAMGTQVGLVAASKKIKATWIRMS